MNTPKVLVVASVGALACSTAMGANVLQNPGFEDGLTSWSGGGAIRHADPAPHEGASYLFGGAVLSFHAYQLVTASTMEVSEADIDAGLVEITFGGWQAGWNGQNDEGRIEVQFLDAAGGLIAASDLGWFHSNHTWVEKSGVAMAPPGTRSVAYGFSGHRLDGSNCDAYLDDAYLIPRVVPTGPTLAVLAVFGIGAMRRRR
ncbi:MAG: hypothetical protein IT432_11380 [Phycisphaerales bacterium]|nr:hypothetical protein [Phycisphaerales bacterium]